MLFRSTGPGGLPLALRLSEGLGRICAVRCREWFGHQYAQEVCMRSPVTGAHQRVTPRLVHGDQGYCRLCRVQRHLGAAMCGGIAEGEVMDLLAEALAFVLRRDGKLPKGPRVRLAQEFDLRVRLCSLEGDRCYHPSIEFAYEAPA